MWPTTRPASVPTERPLALAMQPRRFQLAGAGTGLAGACLVLMLGGCGATLEVQTLATGRSDASAYVLNGGDLDLLRREAERLCPLGGDILRQFGQSRGPELADGGRWRRAVNATVRWFDPPQQAAQMVVVCREPGDRFRLQAAAPKASPPVPAAPAAADAEFSVALPVGPVMPEW